MSAHIPVVKVTYEVIYDDGTASEFVIDASPSHDEDAYLELFWDECNVRVVDRIKQVEVIDTVETYAMILNSELVTLDMTSTQVLNLIDGERRYQNNRWGGPDHDQCHTNLEWGSFITNYLARYVHYESTPATRREALIKIAALAVAALENS